MEDDWRKREMNKTRGLERVKSDRDGQCFNEDCQRYDGKTDTPTSSKKTKEQENGQGKGS